MSESEKTIEQQSAEIANSSGWQSFLGKLKAAAVATGRGARLLHRVASDNKHYVRPVINGLFGDQLAARDDPLAIPMSLRVDGADLSPAELALDLPLSGGARTVVLFVHGVMADEYLWQSTTEQIPCYGTELQQAFGITPLYLRYNSGLHISENGRALSALLRDLFVVLDGQIDQLVLVGHSMGGLVIRSAGHYGAGEAWLDKLRSVFLIGSPNSGAFLEQVVHLATVVLNTIWNFHTRLIAGIINQRSNGIKDLRWGIMLDEDWQGRDPNAIFNGQRTEVPPLEGVRYHIVAGTLAADEMSPLAQYFGDGMVGKWSAMGIGLFVKQDPLSQVGTYKVFNLNHKSLLETREVVDYLQQVIGADCFSEVPIPNPTI